MRCWRRGREFPADPATDILRLRPPRTRSGALAPVIDGDDVSAITASLIDLDRSYLAVQGPPGTGKTYVGSHVIARLVQEQGWRIGVVAQSHAVVENMLDRVVEAGVAPDLVGKAPKKIDEPGRHAYTALAKNGVAAFAAERAESGFVVGGTAWDFSHEGRLARGGLDLLVIDEAGQFSLASTIAVSLVAPRLLLLGDPQQLPQVSQGTHPEPVDTSALGWVIGDHDVLPDPFGYFLTQSWRMHPAVARPVSVLSYDGRLASHACASIRRVEGIEPGLHVQPVAHVGNATESVEEAARVTAIVAGLIGSPYADVDTDRDGISHRPRAAPARAARHHRRDPVQRAADAGGEGAGGCRVPRRARGHGRQVPGSGGRGRHRVAGCVLGRGRTARDRVPAAAQPAQRRDLACEGGRVPRLLARSAR